MASDLWQVDLAEPYALQLSNPGGIHERRAAWSAFVKFDGCVDIYDGREGFHICDLDEMIERLQEVKRLAVEYFDGWPEE